MPGASTGSADPGRLRSEGMRPQGGQGRVGLLGGHHGHQLALVGHIERVDAQQFAGGGHLGRTGSADSSSTTVSLASRANSLQTVPTPPRVASRSQRVDGRRRQQALHQPVEWGGVRRDVSLHGQVAPGEHDRRAVVADGPRAEHHVPLRTSTAESSRPTG